MLFKGCAQLCAVVRSCALLCAVVRRCALLCAVVRCCAQLCAGFSVTGLARSVAKVRLNADDLPRKNQSEREQIEGHCEIIS